MRCTGLHDTMGFYFVVSSAFKKIEAGDILSLTRLHDAVGAHGLVVRPGPTYTVCRLRANVQQ